MDATQRSYRDVLIETITPACASRESAERIVDMILAVPNPQMEALKEQAEWYRAQRAAGRQHLIRLQAALEDDSEN